MLNRFLDAQPWREGFYELGSVLPSVPPSVVLSSSFPRICLLVFSETLYGVKDPYGDVRDRAKFFLEKSPFDKNDQKMVQKLGF